MSDTRSEAKARKILDRIARGFVDVKIKTALDLKNGDFQLVVSDNIWEMLINDMDVIIGRSYPVTTSWSEELPTMRIWNIPTTMSKDLVDDEIRIRAEVSIL